jgi:DNA-binding NarL/FixJ family response regulator
MDTTKVLLADDHQMIIDGLRLMLESEPRIEVVGEAHSGREVIETVGRLDELDVVVLDINMPEMDGIEVTRKLKTSYPEIKILVVTMYNRKEFVKNLVEAGVDGYILKNSGKQELIEGILKVAQGEPYYGSDITRTIMRSYQKYRVFDSPMDIKITEREKDIIRLIAEGCNTQDIAEKLFIAKHTVSTHRKNILSKLEVKNSAGIIRYGIQTGIVKGFDL